VPDRETLELDVLIVGGGPAGMSAALRLSQLQAASGRSPLTIGVLEKSRDAGAHMLSGAILDPSALRDLIPDFESAGAPLAAPVRDDAVYLLTKTGKMRLPITPPPLRNHGHYIISLNAFTRWLAQRVEAAGVDLFTGFAAREVLYDAGKVIGVRTGDRGIDRHGQPKASFEPGVDIHAKVTIFCDGVRGNLTKSLVATLDLAAGRQPQVYALGIKELWEIPADRLAAGTVMHTLGYPLRMEEFGGAFIYAMPGGQVSLGLVSGLDYKDPLFDPHVAFQRFKTHPFVRALLAGGKMVRYGAKALPEGGWYAVPKVHMAGGLIAGDAAGFLNSMRLKGIHLAMRTGMLAAEAAAEAVWAGDVSEAKLAKYQQLIDEGAVRRELFPVRNVHQAFGHGLLPGVLYSGLALATGGWWVTDPMASDGGYRRMETLARYYHGQPPPEGARGDVVKPDRQLTFDKLTNVHFSGTRHTEDQPSHLIVHDTDICRTRCREEYGNPCTRFCPANVYEMVDDGVGGKRLHINASNCVHCKTCDIMDPYQIIDWVPPEGGEGPQYEGM
jgi:electron-transferring-flavoprotein dehydrogenase